MRRQPLFVIIEIIIFAGAEAANALTVAPIPLSGRIVAASLIAAFFALGFVVPSSPRARTLALILDALFLGAIAACSGVAVALTVLLPVRCVELKPRARGALAVSVVFALCVFALASFVGMYVEHRPFAIAAPILIPPYALILLLVMLSEDLRRAYAALAASNAELTLRAERWQQIAISSERYQLGRDLQDTVSQGLKKIDVELERALSEIGANAEAARTFAFHAQRTAAFTLAGLNRSVSTLREASLAQGSLVATLRDMVKAFSIFATSRMTSEIADVPVRDPTIAAGLERIAREALINVARHSEAAAVKLSFKLSDDCLDLRIEDDGVGFDPGAVPPGTGLTVMRERAALIGGEYSIESVPSHGTTVRVTLPLSIAG